MRRTAPWGVLAVLAAPAPTWALGLGNIEPLSALNQPFRAEISISATQQELSTLRVRLAERNVFESAGLDRPAFMSNFRFEVAQNASGQDVIRVLSSQTVPEPFVTMIIEAETMSGGLQRREYTVFLDPPVLSANRASAPIQSAAVGGAQNSGAQAPIQRPAAPQQPAPAPAVQAQPRPQPQPQSQSQAAPASNPDTYGPVQRSETLWAIADRMRPASTTINQAMISIFEANPQAFSGNMNLLRAGTILRIPTAAEFGSITAAEANAAVQEQNERWRSGNTAPVQRLELVTPSVEPDSSTSQVQPPPQQPAAGGANALADARGEADALREELAEAQRLIEARNAEMAALQNRLSELEAAAGGQDMPAADTGEDAAGEEPDSVFADTDTPDETQVADETPAVESTPAPVASTTSAEPTLMERITGYATNSWVLIGAGVLALLAALLWFVRSRREEDVLDDATGQWDPIEAGMDDPTGSSTFTRGRRTGAGDDFIVEERSSRKSTTMPIEDPDQVAAEAFSQAQHDESIDDTLSTSAVLDLDSADPIAEADFHMAYGLYDQAAELLTASLREEPDRKDLKLKLLEVYFVWGNKDEFIEMAREVHATVGDGSGEWDKVVIMGKQICPDDELFQGASTGSGEAAGSGAPADLDFSFEDTGEHGIDLDISDMDQDESDDEYEIDLDLTGDMPALRLSGTESLDIGIDTAASLEQALLDDDDAGEDDETAIAPRNADSTVIARDNDATVIARDDDATAIATRGMSGLDPESLVATQESPALTNESAWDSDEEWGEDTIETPTIEVGGASPDAPTVESPAMSADASYDTEIIQRSEGTAELPRLDETQLRGAGRDTSGPELTEEIDVNDLGLDMSDIDSLGSDLDALDAELGDIGDFDESAETGFADDDSEGDTREQPALDIEELSATGVTEVLRTDDDDVDDLAPTKTAMMAPELGEESTAEASPSVDSTFGTEAFESLESDDLDLDLDDLSRALDDAETVEQPQPGVSDDSTVHADEPTGTEDLRAADPQTMTEVGTKLDLARAYIDMGDPDGARSILEEVLSEGDSGQRNEAQSLMETLTA